MFLQAGSQEFYRVILVNDPPFGGMVEALSASLASLEAMWASGMKDNGVDSAVAKEEGS